MDFKKFASRKLLVAILTPVFTAIVNAYGLPIPAEVQASLIGMLAAYVLGQSYIDKAEIDKK